MSLAAGTPVGPYRVVSLLGVGGMGEVYRVHDPRLRRDIALKLISKALAPDAAAVDRFIRETLAVSALNHPNVVTIYEAGETAHGRYIAMELVNGRSLRDLVREGLDPDRACDVGRQVAEALAVAHGHQVVHRDVKPENVMVRDDGYVKVLDFGLARVVPEGGAGDSRTVSFATHTGMVLGTMGYMSPEQARGEPVTPASDVFSLGIVLYEALTGQHPFPAATPLAVLHAILTDAPIAPSRLRPGVPPALDRLVLECLQKDARLRPASKEVSARLRGSGAGGALLAPGVRVAVTPHPIVGRDAERLGLEQAWAQASGGRGLLVAVSAEPGFGKTALVEHTLQALAARGEVFRVARGRASERLAGTDAYLPVLEALEGLLRSETHGSLARTIKVVAPTWHAQIASQPQLAADLAPDAADPGPASQQRLKREMTAFLDEASRLVPLVLFLDDVHWADHATVDLLAYLATRLPSMRVLVVVTARPSALAHAKHPFLPLKLELQARGICREMALDALPPAAVERYVALEFPGHRLPASFVGMIHRRTEGHPLFLVDLLRDLRRRGVVARRGEDWVLAEGVQALERELPESVRSMIQRKIDALDEDGRQLLSAAAVQGVDFDSAIVAHALDRSEEGVEDALGRLEREHALVRFLREEACPDRTVTLRFRFAHVLYQNALYAALRATRRATLAGAVASGLVRRWGDRSPEIAHELAILFEAARGTLAAARYYGLAAQSAAQLFASQEARALAERGLEVLDPLPEDPARDRVELELQMTRALAIKTGTGYAVVSVGDAYRRARELTQRVDDPVRVVPVLMGLSAHYIGAGEIEVAQDVATHLLAVAAQLADPHLEMIGEWCLGVALHHLGDLTDAHRHLLRSMDLYDPAFHQARAWQVGIEPGIFCQCELARTTWLLGRPDEAIERCRRVEAQARALGHPQSLAFALLFQGLIRQLRREPAEALVVHDALVALCEQKGIAQERTWARMLHGWIVCELGDADEGLRELGEGLAEQEAVRSYLLRPYYRALEGEVLLRAGRLDEAMAVVDDGLAVSFRTAQHMFDSELLRVRALVLARRQGATSEDVRTAFARALGEAAGQQALSLELRAAQAWAEWLADTGDAAAARGVLEPVLARYTEEEARA